VGAVAVVVIALVAFIATRGGGTAAPRDTTADTTLDTTADTTAGTGGGVTTTAAAIAGAPPLTADQLAKVVVVKSDLVNSWKSVPQDQGDNGISAVCGQTLPAKPVTSLIVGFTRFSNNFDETLINTVESYQDAATLTGVFATFRDLTRSCTHFDTTDPSTGAVQNLLIQTQDVAPLPGCQSALELRLDNVTPGSGLSGSRVGLFEVCGNNAPQVTMDFLATDDPASIDAEINRAMTACVTKLLAITAVAGG
jgi:hypothetical protein